MGWVEGEEIVCAYHGLRYGPDGLCRKIPAHPDIAPSPRLKLTMFPVAERYGLVWTRLDPGDDKAAIPAFPLWDAAGFQQIVPPFVDIAGSAARQVEGFVDVAHFAWIHHDAFADRDNPVVPIYDTKLTDFGLRTEYWSNVSNYPRGLQHLAPAGLPLAARLRDLSAVRRKPDGALPRGRPAEHPQPRQPGLGPQDAHVLPMVRNFDTTGPLEAVYAFNAQIFAEDQAIIERQKPEELPLDAQQEAHFPADRTSLGYRRLLRQMGLSFKYVT